MIKRKSLLGALSCVFFAALIMLGVSLGMPKASASTDKVTMTEGAFVRIAEDVSGIRFTAKLTNALASGEEAGILIAQKSDLTGDEIPAFDLEGFAVEGEVSNEDLAAAQKKISNVKAIRILSDGTFHAVLTDIPASGYSTQLVARAYVRNGNDVSYSPTYQTRSIGQAASIGLNKGEANQTIANGLKAYVDGSGAAIVSKDESATVELGGTKQLTVTCNPAEYVVAYSSEDDTIATVDNKGVVTGKKIGTTNIKIALGSTVQTIPVTVDVPAAAKTELSGGYVSSVQVPETGTFTANYTTDTEKLPSGATIGIDFNGNFTPKSGWTTEALIRIPVALKAGSTYKLSYKVNVYSHGNITNTHYILNLSDSVNGKTPYTNLLTASGSGTTLKTLYECKDWIIAPTTDMEYFTFYVTLSPTTYENFNFVISNIQVRDLSTLNAVVKSAAANITAVEDTSNETPVIKITGGADVVDDSLVEIKTKYDLAANTEYLVSYKFNVVNAVAATSTKLGWAFSFGTQLSSETVNYTTATTIKQDTFNSFTDWTNKCANVNLTVTPTSSVKDFSLKILIHGTYFSSFDIEVSEILIIEKAKINECLLGAAQSSTWNNWVNYGANYIKDISNYSIQKGGEDLDIGKTVIMAEGKSSSTSNAYADYALTNATWETGKTYNISFKIIDFNIYTSSGNYWWTHVGIVGESVGGTTNMTSLQAYRTGGYVTTEDITINGVAKKLFTINIEYKATVTKTPPSLRILLGAGTTQQIGIVDISITEKPAS